MNLYWLVEFVIDKTNLTTLCTGYDLIPENKGNYYPGTPFDTNLKDGKQYIKEEIKMHTCRTPVDDGSTWHVQRIVSLFRCLRIPQCIFATTAHFLFIFFWSVVFLCFLFFADRRVHFILLVAMTGGKLVGRTWVC